MKARLETIRTRLEQLSRRYPFFGGTIERTAETDIPRLRWHSLSTPNIKPKAAVEHNNASAELDAVANDLLPILLELGIEVPDGETSGAKLMHLMLRDEWKPRRVSVSTPGNAFDAILGAIAKITPSENPVGTVAIPVGTVDGLVASSRPKRKSAVEQADAELESLAAAGVIDSSWKLKDLAGKLKRAEKTISQTKSWRKWMAKK